MKGFTKIIFILFLIGSNQPIYSQNISYNYIVDTTDIETKKVQQLFENYIHSQPDSIFDNPYWTSSEKLNKKYVDVFYDEFYPSLYLGYPIHVLSISSNNSLYKIKAQFSYCDKNNIPNVLAIVNYYAEKENGVYKLKNALNINKNKWQHILVGIVDYYYPASFTFDIEKAKQLNVQITEICNNLNVKAIPFEYYLANEYEEIQTLKGIDYYLGMGGELKPTGKASIDKVYCAGLGENYVHEVFHLQIDRAYPNKHFWISEGLATFIGGSRGQTLNWHIKRANSYLKNHQTINLNNLVSYSNMDEYTSYHYVFGGLIVKLIFEKGGWEMVKEFMNTGKTDIDYYLAIEKYLGIKQVNLNVFLRKQLEIEALK